LILIGLNTIIFYNNYFNEYPKKLSNIWFNDPGIRIVSKEAYEILLKSPSRNLFFNTPESSFIYHNLYRINPNDAFYGNGILSMVFSIDDETKPLPKKDDLILIQEPFDPSKTSNKIKYLHRTTNKYASTQYGAGLIEIE